MNLKLSVHRWTSQLLSFTVVRSHSSLASLLGDCQSHYLEISPGLYKIEVSTWMHIFLCVSKMLTIGPEYVHFKISDVFGVFFLGLVSLRETGPHSQLLQLPQLCSAPQPVY